VKSVVHHLDGVVEQPVNVGHESGLAGRGVDELERFDDHLKSIQ
jgi:hypothetical protein